MSDNVPIADFTCQYCSRPINLDESFASIHPDVIEQSHLASSSDDDSYSDDGEITPTRTPHESPALSPIHSRTRTPTAHSESTHSPHTTDKASVGTSAHIHAPAPVAARGDADSDSKPNTQGPTVSGGTGAPKIGPTGASDPPRAKVQLNANATVHVNADDRSSEPIRVVVRSPPRSPDAKRDHGAPLRDGVCALSPAMRARAGGSADVSANASAQYSYVVLPEHEHTDLSDEGTPGQHPRQSQTDANTTIATAVHRKTWGSADGDPGTQTNSRPTPNTYTHMRPAGGEHVRGNVSGIEKGLGVYGASGDGDRVGERVGARGYDVRERLDVMVLSDLFDYASGESNIDHPMCAECADQLVRVLEDQLDEAKAEEKMYTDFVDSHYSDEQEIIQQAQHDKEQLAIYAAEEAELIAQLEVIENERAETRADVIRLSAERDELKTDEEMFWKEVNEVQRQVTDFVQTSAQVHTNHQHVLHTLERLKRTNIYNDAFHIWADVRGFGTINELRLGRSAHVQVPWEEINAAWGQAVLLLDTLASHIGLTFSLFRLHPQGSRSRLERLDNGQHLDLWLSSGLQVFKTASYDQAMVAYLNCLHDLSKRIEVMDQRFKLPYEQTPSQKDKIGGASIKRGLPNTDEKWTKACKFTLTNLKWCLTWICKCVPDTQDR
ncbi:hypothetical protein SARC_06170 [Sphaeroforma arctica JP610]|uniref:Autophagy-related protein 6 n=1 Tax=Sphaeroforma arctica JP610 TaxID=667725 RepID=A0A0L0FXZ0_9EUKA|nr:hypothetical protein SARC_06170 [Sphaeroforma arctica JP610]KNC81504.1 hypothetical protein SARC_06170 [Sphaeroforma arctica JP610]|eukprot:XP_014155406.1 hypothetical protein SARC_06170 [Sphaeroforma arctica JP610]